ncbi:MAG: radical SAM protein [Bryobacteraceae bacterium]
MRLAGIARLAAESDLLEAKSRVRYFEIESRSILNRTRPGMPFTWTLNPYRGCEFGCKYCFARYTHEFMELPDNFEDRIYAKAAAPEILKREFHKVKHREGIAIGTATDPYQPAERRFQRTRAILEVFAAEKGRRVSITTRSDLITRDLDLLREVGRRHALGVNITITTLDANLARLLEPRAPHPGLRVGAIAALRRAGIHTGVFANPVMPGLTDGDANLESLARAVKAAGAEWFGGESLFLMPSAEKVFLPLLAARFPHLLERYRTLYARAAFLSRGYKDALRARVESLRRRHGLASAPVDYRPELWQEEREQLSLF